MSRTVVFDVNILISAVIAPGGAPARALQSALEQGWDVETSGHIVQKLIEVLGRPRFYSRLGNNDLSAFLLKYQAYTTRVIPDRSVRGVCDDEEDDLVLGTAVAANADYLVTGDKGFQQVSEHRGVRIVGASEFLHLIRGELESDT